MVADRVSSDATSVIAFVACGPISRSVGYENGENLNST
jgi:hypothetical protein